MKKINISKHQCLLGLCKVILYLYYGLKKQRREAWISLPNTLLHYGYYSLCLWKFQSGVFISFNRCPCKYLYAQKFYLQWHIFTLNTVLPWLCSAWKTASLKLIQVIYLLCNHIFGLHPLFACLQLWTYLCTEKTSPTCVLWHVQGCILQECQTAVIPPITVHILMANLA